MSRRAGNVSQDQRSPSVFVPTIPGAVPEPLFAENFIATWRNRLKEVHDGLIDYRFPHEREGDYVGLHPAQVAALRRPLETLAIVIDGLRVLIPGAEGDDTFTAERFKRRMYEEDEEEDLRPLAAKKTKLNANAGKGKKVGKKTSTGRQPAKTSTTKKATKMPVTNATTANTASAKPKAAAKKPVKAKATTKATPNTAAKATTAKATATKPAATQNAATAKPSVDKAATTATPSDAPATVGGRPQRIRRPPQKFGQS